MPRRAPGPPGSSPLARGKRRPRGGDIVGDRLIPARAGKTFRARRGLDAGEAHPRSRGENIMTETPLTPVGGSSPLARGKPRRSGGPLPGRRLIPARAGKTWPSPAKTSRQPAHPRSRGENGLDGDETTLEQGSSPLAQGKRVTLIDRSVMARLIPARAGKTDLSHAASSVRAAHPRSRGEN